MGVVKDIEGNSYTTVVIGNQEWTCENLKCNPKAGVASVYNDDNANLAIYGYLYDWAAAKSFNDYDYIAGEKGWHLPSDDEWKQLEIALGMTQAEADKSGVWRGTDQGTKLKQGGSSKVDLLLGGYGYGSSYGYLGSQGYYWSSIENGSNARYRIVDSEMASVYRDWYNNTDRYSVRLVRQAPIPTIEVPDILISKGGQLHSLRGQTIWKDGAGHTFNAGCGVVKNGILYALKPVAYLQDFTPDPADPIGTEVMLTDKRDNIVYRCIKMADGRWWMGENLKYETASGSSVYQNNPANLETYGRLYEWQTAIDAAPERWSLPSDVDWKALEMALGMTQEEADKIGWRGTDQGTQLKQGGSSKIDLLCGGLWDNNYIELGIWGYYWSSTAYDSSHAWVRGVNSSEARMERYRYNKASRYSVRCILDV